MRNILAILLTLLSPLYIQAAEPPKKWPLAAAQLEDRHVDVMINEREKFLELQVRVTRLRQVKSWEEKSCSAWLLTQNGGAIKQVSPLSRSSGLQKSGRVIDFFNAEFEKQPLTNIALIVLYVEGKALTFDRNNTRSVNAVEKIQEPVKKPPANEANRGRIPARIPADERVPNGVYSINLEWWGSKQAVTMRIHENTATVISSSDPRLEGMTGTFGPGKNGRFGASFQTKDGYNASQGWHLQKDGNFRIVEVPDRGEDQRAVLIPQNL